ncbi:hypothetical protein BCR42DRAFT_495953 [Absidia repens]|uniref:Heterokaryon incompatibility domain-containing protein n=1 Tax=Absidia repens TaxID=90262 RepID=A0A1X2I1I4_9FUNG|nr:hypothetical protein BCR42DRAFT_495953 [Absidia repens]
MTKDEPVEHLFQELACDDPQQQQQQQEQKPFHVVLIDIEKTAELESVHCVEKPLEGDIEELSFVALSYRWGELQEQSIDTKCGYIASITSFALDDFYSLCRAMMKEPDLKSIKYVWVDAICVDQTNYERRKATIHQMSNIYEKATYILAVPDLHKQHLTNVSQANEHIMENLYYCHNLYIYYLIQGNTEKLTQLDGEFLDEIKLPKDPMLRRMLKKYTHCFMDGFTKNTDRHFYAQPSQLVALLYDISQAETLTNDHSYADVGIGKTETQADRYASFENLFGCNKKDIDWWEWEKRRKAYNYSKLSWKDLIINREKEIRQSMELLNDLIVDWSSRVWVISEYHIAKKKNNLKLWFIGFTDVRYYIDDVPFFKFDFLDSTLSSAGRNAELEIDKLPSIYLQFHETMARRLVAQSFFEMMLCSKASKTEDRFYAILPQSKYKDKINQVAHWKINNMVSVKLKLFEIMDTKDKLTLLFLAAERDLVPSNTERVLPTFATSTISKYTCNSFTAEYPLNFDLGNKSTITLHHHARDSHLYYFLQLTAKEYCVMDMLSEDDRKYYTTSLMRPKLAKACDDLQLNLASSEVKIVYLTYFDRSTMMKSAAEMLAVTECKLYLFGSFEKNKWMLTTVDYPCRVIRHSVNNNGTVFNIY